MYLKSFLKRKTLFRHVSHEIAEEVSFEIDSDSLRTVPNSLKYGTLTFSCILECISNVSFKEKLDFFIYREKYLRKLVSFETDLDSLRTVRNRLK